MNRWLTGGKKPEQSIVPYTVSACVEVQLIHHNISKDKMPFSPSCASSHTFDRSLLLTCVASVTDASCRYSELPHPYSCPSLHTARLQSPYVLICCTSTPARSPPTSTGVELTLWCPRPGTMQSSYSSNSYEGNCRIKRQK